MRILLIYDSSLYPEVEAQTLEAFKLPLQTDDIMAIVR